MKLDKLLYFFAKICSIFPLKKYIVFESNSDFTDNSKALCDYIINNKIAQNYKIFWAVKDYKKDKKNLPYSLILKHFYKKNPIQFIKTLYVLTRAQYCFYSHDVIGNKYVKNQVRCFLMHGTSLKNLKKIYGDTLKPSTHAIATSEFTKNIHNKTKNGIGEITEILGYPRNDRLFITQDKKTTIKKKLDIDNYKKIIIWMPTFKHHNISTRNDFNQDIDNDLSIVTDNVINELNEFLTKNNVALIIKLHPAQNLSYIKIETKGNIKVLTNKDLYEKEIDPYELLGISDSLITDFSSVYTDYLLLDKPIGFEISNIKNYKDGVGFLIDNPLEYMPGMLIQNKDDLIKFTKSIIEEEDKYKEERKKIKDIYHKYCDNNSSKRIVNFFEIGGKNEKI